MIMSDIWIREQAEKGMIEPFVDQQVRSVVQNPYGNFIGASKEPKKTISFGVSSYGYDMRLAREFKIFTNAYCAVIDPKNMPEEAFVTVEADDFILAPPHSFVLARSVERFKIPHDILALVIGKSTYARCGLIVNCTPMEPGWEGYLTIELSNTTPMPMKIYVGEGIAQALFYHGDQPSSVNYATRAGKYQAQGAEIVLPRV